MIRIAAAGDVHFDRNSSGKLAQHFDRLREVADILLLAGDLTQVGHLDEAKILAEDLSQCPIPVVAVLGNHDYHSNETEKIIQCMQTAGVHILERNAAVFEIQNTTVGIVGLKGFGGGFIGASAGEFGEPEMKAFIHHTKVLADTLQQHLENLNTDYKIALLHYSPVPETLMGEKREIYPFLGSYLLAEAIDRGGADIVFHGHAHKGTEKGATPGGVPVRNVAQPVIRHAFNIYTLNKEGIIGHAGYYPRSFYAGH